MFFEGNLENFKQYAIIRTQIELQNLFLRKIQIFTGYEYNSQFILFRDTKYNLTDAKRKRGGDICRRRVHVNVRMICNLVQMIFVRFIV